jgi:hypothetical protein
VLLYNQHCAKLPAVIGYAQTQQSVVSAVADWTKNIDNMKNILIFISGCVVGVVATMLVLFVISIGIRQDTTINESKTQYIEIKGKKGDVILHTGMPKDSVKILVGKPDEVNLHSIGSTAYEKWGYKIRNQYISDLDIDFKDSKLESVRQK